jgi:hypothetical protein
MALGAITKVKKVGQKPSAPTFCDLITFPGDGAYPAGGTPGFLALLQAAFGQARTIIAVIDQTDPGVGLNFVEYDHTNDKLFMRVRTTGVESAVANQSAITYRVMVISQ